jgi:hypothetical protein
MGATRRKEKKRNTAGCINNGQNKWVATWIPGDGLTLGRAHHLFKTD